MTADVYSGNCIRLNDEEVQLLQKQLKSEGVHSYNPSLYSPKSAFKRAIIDAAKELPNYFSRLYVVSGEKSMLNVDYLGVNHAGVNLLRREKTEAVATVVKHDCLNVVEKMRFVSTNRKQNKTKFADPIKKYFVFCFYFYSYDDISEILIPSNCTLQILFKNGEWITLYSNKVSAYMYD